MNVDANIQRLESGETLTSNDKLIFDLVRKTCATFESRVVVRVAGGWVRDRLMNHISDDIDLTVEGTDWREFATRIQKMCDPEREIVVIEANLEQSKSVSTARVRVEKDVWLDICGLQYDQAVDECATAESDARRRDFTLNAVFFNINENKVEDFVGGIEDLKAGVLRTPIDAINTLTNDPLRIIRGFRFGCVYNFKIDDSIIEAAPQLRKEFETKITRNRIGTELTKAMKSPNAAKMVEWLHKTGLFMSVFDVVSTNPLNEAESVEHATTALQRSTDNSLNMSIMLAAIYKHIFCQPSGKNKKTQPDPIVKGLLLSSKVDKESRTLCTAADTLTTLIGNINRVTVGKWIMKAGPLWCHTHTQLFDDTLHQFYNNELVPFIQSESMTEIYTLKPLMDGKQLCKAFGVKPGPSVGRMIEELIEWQLQNPTGSTDNYLKAKVGSA